MYLSLERCLEPTRPRFSAGDVELSGYPAPYLGSLGPPKPPCRQASISHVEICLLHPLFWKSRDFIMYEFEPIRISFLSNVFHIGQTYPLWPKGRHSEGRYFMFSCPRL